MLYFAGASAGALKAPAKAQAKAPAEAPSNSVMSIKFLDWTLSLRDYNDEHFHNLSYEPLSLLTNLPARLKIHVWSDLCKRWVQIEYKSFVGFLQRYIKF